MRSPCFYKVTVNVVSRRLFSEKLNVLYFLNSVFNSVLDISMHQLFAHICLQNRQESPQYYDCPVFLIHTVEKEGAGRISYKRLAVEDQKERKLKQSI